LLVFVIDMAEVFVLQVRLTQFGVLTDSEEYYNELHDRLTTNGPGVQGHMTSLLVNFGKYLIT